MPEFLTLLHGVIDSPDIPLNVSRSYLQADGNVKKISKYITKKLGISLLACSKTTERILKKWNEIKVFIEYGMLTEKSFLKKQKISVPKTQTKYTLL